MRFEKDRDLYARMYPQVRKWLNTCIVCQTEGYKPELPDTIPPGLLAHNIRKYWEELAVNDLGVCEACARYMEGD